MAHTLAFVVKDDRIPQGFVQGATIVAQKIAGDILGSPFTYTGAVQEITLPAGSYFVECWGGRGFGTGSQAAGFGGYAAAKITLTEDSTVYVYVGEGANGHVFRTAGGWNGGGNGLGGGISAYRGGGGAGATDIRIGGNTLYDRVIVAAGGGGSGYYNIGGHGGGLTGNTAPSGGAGGEQEIGGNVGGVFGLGGNATGSYQGAGGGGWFGGGRSPSNYYGGGGGSSYIGDVLEIDGHSFPKIITLNGVTTVGVKNGHGEVRIRTFARYEDATDINGELSFPSMEPGTWECSISKEHYLADSRDVTIVASDVEEVVVLGAARSRITNVGLQVDVFEGPIQSRITNIALQVEVGEYYSVAQPLRTRPVPAKARVFPVYANARVTGIP